MLNHKNLSLTRQTIAEAFSPSFVILANLTPLSSMLNEQHSCQSVGCVFGLVTL